MLEVGGLRLATAQEKKPLNFSGFFVVYGLLFSLFFVQPAAANNKQAEAEAKKPWYESILSRSARESLDWLLNKPADVTLTPAEIQALPYAAQYMRVGDGSQNLVILGEVDALPEQPRMQWFSATDEVIETYQGRVYSVQNLKHPQVKALWLASATDTTLAFDKRITSVYHSEHQPHFMMVRESFRVQRQETTATLLMPNGEQLATRVVHEWLYPQQQPATAQQEPVAKNEFYYDLASGRVVQSKQWLGAELGYLESQEVKPYTGQLATATSKAGLTNWGFQPVNTVDDLKRHDGGDPTEYMQVHVQVTDTSNNRQQQYRGLFLSRDLRLNTVMTEFHKQGFSQVPYEPLTRLHSPKLDQWFAGRKAGMLMRLRMLEQTYKADGNDKLAAQAAELTQAFLSWPLRATYRHGWSQGLARLYLAENPLLNVADATTDARTATLIPRYEVSFTTAPNQTLHVGLATDLAEHDRVYVTDAFGKITRVPVQGYNSTPEQRLLAAQPGAIVLHSIADNDLPKGFRDINEQLAQFLQHWDWSVRPE